MTIDKGRSNDSKFESNLMPVSSENIQECEGSAFNDDDMCVSTHVRINSITRIEEEEALRGDLHRLDVSDEKVQQNEQLVFSMDNKELGQLGEVLAKAYFEDQGYRIIQSNYWCPEGEADLVVLDDKTVVLAEVKTRRVFSFDTDIFPEEAVDSRKQKIYRRIAQYYFMKHHNIEDLRFDVIGILLMPKGIARVQHIIGAFSMDDEW